MGIEQPRELYRRENEKKVRSRGHGGHQRKEDVRPPKPTGTKLIWTHWD